MYHKGNLHSEDIYPVVRLPIGQQDFWRCWGLSFDQCITTQMDNNALSFL